MPIGNLCLSFLRLQVLLQPFCEKVITDFENICGFRRQKSHFLVTTKIVFKMALILHTIELNVYLLVRFCKSRNK